MNTCTELLIIRKHGMRSPFRNVSSSKTVEKLMRNWIEARCVTLKKWFSYEIVLSSIEFHVIYFILFPPDDITFLISHQLPRFSLNFPISFFRFGVKYKNHEQNEENTIPYKYHFTKYMYHYLILSLNHRTQYSSA